MTDPDDATARSAEARPGDEVEAARAWLRRNGVEPPPHLAGPASVSAPGRRDRRRGLASSPSDARSGRRPVGDRDDAGPESDRPDGPAAEGDRLEGPVPARGRLDGVAAEDGRLTAPGRGGGRPDGVAAESGLLDGSELEGGHEARPGLGSSAGWRAGGELDPDADPEDVARRIVLRTLAAQARTRAELERALHKKAVPAEAATAVLDRMGEVGLVDDATFARDWVASRQQRRHLSRSALRRELQTKGVDREVIDDALGGVDASDEHRAALDLARRRAASMAGLTREVAYRRLGGVLTRRGFSPAVTARVLSEVLDIRDGGSDPTGP